MRKKLCTAVLTAMLGLSVFNMTVLARDIDPDEFIETDLVQVPVNFTYDGTFTERVELYVDGYPATAFWYDESLENNGYKGFVSAKPGTHGLRVFSSTDVSDSYDFEYPETFNTDKDKEKGIQIKVVAAPDNSGDDGEYSGHEEGAERGEMHGAEILVPSQYDFSDGTESGTIHIEAKNYGAVKTLTYRLVGKDRVYDITLDNDHVFEADVILPVGQYYESGELDVGLAENAVARSDVHFSWAHKNNPSFFGSYYEVTNGNTINITDLIVNMTQGNETTELNSEILFADKREKNRVQAQQEHQQEELQSAFPETYGSDGASAPTIATAETTDTKHFDLRKIIVPILACAVVFGVAAGGIYLIRKKKR